jgi:hypothetical protein
MAVRKQKLRQRIAAQPSNAATAMGNQHPAIPSTPMAMPVAQVVVGPPYAGTVSVGYAEFAPLYLAGDRGAAVPGTGPGRWDQLRAAGRP